MQSARAAVEVTAGIIPGDPMPEHTRQWFLTSDEWHSPKGRKRLNQLRRSAQDYAANLPFPEGLNWVRVDVVWF